MYVLFLLMLAGFGTAAEAQTRTPTGLRATPPTYLSLSGLYIGPRAGLGFYGGDDEAANIRRSNRPGYGAELSWQAGPHFALVADYFKARYPRIQDEPTLQTLRLMARYTLTHGWFDPYFLIGGHATLGGAKDAYGPVGGVGIAIRLASWVQVYNEVSINFTFPDRALDNHIGGSDFDLTGALSFGFRFRGLGGSSAPRRPPLTTTNPPSDTPEPIPSDDVVFNDVDLPSPPPLAAGYTWVVAAFSDVSQADSALATYINQGYEGQIVPVRERGQQQYRVTLGRYRNREEAAIVRTNLPSGTWLLFTTFDAPTDVETTPPITDPVTPDPEPIADTPTPEPVTDASTDVDATAPPVDPPAEEPEAPEETAPPAPPLPTPEPVTVNFPVDPAPSGEQEETTPIPSPTTDSPIFEPVPDPTPVDPPTVPAPKPQPDPPATTQPQDDYYTLVIAALSSRERAEAELRTYVQRGYEGQVLETIKNGRPLYRVVLGRYASEEAAQAVRQSLRTDNWILAVPGTASAQTTPTPRQTSPPPPAPLPDTPAPQTTQPSASTGYFTWVVGVFGGQTKARGILRNYTDEGHTGQVLLFQKGARTLYRVTLGRYPSEEEAESLSTSLPRDAWLLFVEE